MARSRCRAAASAAARQVLLRHQVCIDIVIGNGTVLVGAGDSVDPESAVAVLVAERTPQPSRLHEQVQADRLLKGGVVRGANVPDRGTGDICVDMESGRSCRPVTGTFLPLDGAPRERRAVEPQLPGPLDRQRQRAMAPPEGVGGRIRCGVGQHRQHEGLGIPERVPVIPRPGQPFRRDRPALCARPGLQDVKQPKTHGLLNCAIAVKLDIGACPEPVEVARVARPAAPPNRSAWHRPTPRRPGRELPATTGNRTTRTRRP